MILHGRNIDDLGELSGNEAGHVGTRLPLSEKVGLAIDSVIVAGMVSKPLLNPNDANSRRAQCLIAADIDLIRVSVVDHDVAGRNSSPLHPGYDLAKDLMFF